MNAALMWLKAWGLFIVGDIASRVPWNSRFVARIYTKAMNYPAYVGMEYNVGPLKGKPLNGKGRA